MWCFCYVAGMDRAWIYTENRLRNEFKDGLLGFLETADQDRLRREGKWTCYPCLMSENCKNIKSTTEIQTHLIKRGFMLGYACWSKHGEHISAHGGVKSTTQPSPCRRCWAPKCRGL